MNFGLKAWSIASDVDKEERNELHLPRPLRHIIEPTFHKLTLEQRREIAQKAARTRWSKARVKEQKPT